MNRLYQKIQTLLDRQIGKSQIYSVVVAMQSQNGDLDFCGAAGISDPQRGVAMTPDTPYFIASITKMFTAAIIMQLFAEKRLNLEAPIRDYLPERLTRGIHTSKGRDYSDRITVDHLLNQTSGLPDYEADRPRGGKSVLDDLKSGKDRPIDLDEALRITQSLPAHFAPGAAGKAYYSNFNYRLLGAIIEGLTQKPMAVNFQERICGPLGLRNTYLFDAQHPRRDQPAPATLYLNRDPAYVPQYLSSNISDGGLVSTAPECMIFLRAFLEGRLFDRACLARMTRWNPMFFPLRYGSGMMYFRLPRYFWFQPLPEFIGHSGSVGSFAFFCPSRSVYLTGTLNQINSPAKPYFFMMDLVRALA